MKYIMLSLMVCLSLGNLQAQEMDRDDIHQDRLERVQALKIAYITNELSLTPDESARFWAIYNTYENNLHQIKKENRKQMPNPRVEELNDAQAAEAIQQMIAMDEQELALKKQLVKELEPVIGNVRIVKLKVAEKEFKRKLLGEIRAKGDAKRKRKSY